MVYGCIMTERLIVHALLDRAVSAVAAICSSATFFIYLASPL